MKFPRLSFARSYAGRAHIEIIVLLTCIGTLAVLTASGEPENVTTETAAPIAVSASVIESR